MMAIVFKTIKPRNTYSLASLFIAASQCVTVAACIRNNVVNNAATRQWHVLPLATPLNNFLQTEKQPRTAVNFTDPICLDMPSAYCLDQARCVTDLS